MKNYSLILSLGLFTLLSNAVLAENTACMIEGEFEILGQKIYSKDCIEFSEANKTEQLKTMCEALANTSAQLGGQAGKVTYSASCPRPAQGACKNMGGSTATAYYYARTAEDLKTLPQGCNMMGGQWQSTN